MILRHGLRIPEPGHLMYPTELSEQEIVALVEMLNENKTSVDYDGRLEEFHSAVVGLHEYIIARAMTRITTTEDLEEAA